MPPRLSGSTESPPTMMRKPTA